MSAVIRTIPSQASSAAVVSGKGKASQRADWVDSAKGIGIVLVVIGHVIGGMVDANMTRPEHGLPTLFFVIYTFHMPLFFLLGGLFVPHRAEANPGRFVQGLLKRLVWPYFLWSTIQLLVIAMAGTAVNNPYPFRFLRLVELLWHPTSQFWYLHALFLMHLASALLFRRLGAPGLFLLALGALGANTLFDFPESMSNLCRFLPFYAAGVAMGLRVRAHEAHTISLPLALLAWVGWIVLALTAMGKGFHVWDVAAIPAAVLGTIGWLGLSQQSLVRASKTLRYLGRNSMAIFLVHVLFTSGARIVLTRVFSPNQDLLIFALSIVIGLVGPVLVYELAKRLKLASMLGFE